MRHHRKNRNRRVYAALRVYTSIHGGMIAALAFVGYAAPCLSEPLSFVAIVNGPSLHISPNHYNRATWGAGLGVNFSPSCFAGAGHYTNSAGNGSDYAGISCVHDYNSGLVAEIAAGAITGYTDGMRPFILPSIGWRVRSSSRLMLTVIPPIGHVRATAINIRLEIGF